jgi:hypothetical protein
MRPAYIARVLAIPIAAALAGACSDNITVPTAPIANTTSTPGSCCQVEVFGVPPPFPPAPRPARIYVDPEPRPSSMHGSPVASRYLLFEDGTFALQYASANYPFFEYRGTYREVGAVIKFEWEGCCGWYATGSVESDSMKVEYSTNMVMSDFINGVYVRQK